MQSVPIARRYVPIANVCKYMQMHSKQAGFYLMESIPLQDQSGLTDVPGDVVSSFSPSARPDRIDKR